MIRSYLTKITVTLLLSGVTVVRAQQTSESFVLATKYLLYLPGEYSADTVAKWPLVIFLHGSGESGEDLAKVKVHGPPKLVEQGRKFPFILVSPQAPPRTGWNIELLKGMLNDLKQRYRVDPDRIYLTGLSMGGYGTWNFASRYPDEFAAIAPVCGGGNPADVWKLRHMAVWCFHGAKDDVVLPSQSQRMVDELRKYNAGVKFTLYPDANHNSWDTTYNNDTFYTWLLQQRKFHHRQSTESHKQLQLYQGRYVSESNDTVTLVQDKSALVVETGSNRIPLHRSSENNFYWDENSIGELQFSVDGSGAVNGFTLLADDKIFFKKTDAAHTKKAVSK